MWVPSKFATWPARNNLAWFYRSIIIVINKIGDNGVTFGMIAIFWSIWWELLWWIGWYRLFFIAPVSKQSAIAANSFPIRLYFLLKCFNFLLLAGQFAFSDLIRRCKYLIRFNELRFIINNHFVVHSTRFNNFNRANYFNCPRTSIAFAWWTFTTLFYTTVAALTFAWSLAFRARCIARFAWLLFNNITAARTICASQHYGKISLINRFN